MENKKEDEIHDLLKQTIARKDIERQIADLFYKLCPHVPPQLLAATVMQTLDNFKELENLYNSNIKKDYKSNAIDSIKYANELMLSKDTIIGKPESATEIKMFYENENHIPRI